jgi:GH24 family phage-related lysozyme (muramidase)
MLIMFPILRIGDGFPKVSIDKRDAVLRLQRALVKASVNVDKDGLFGEGTRKAVIVFQDNHGLQADGIVGPATWEKLKPFLRSGEKKYISSSSQISLLEGFNGDLNWVHELEGHAGRPYWPGGESGVTLDPGFDLGYQSEKKLKTYYPEFTRAQIDALSGVLGIKGSTAKSASKQSSVSSIRTSKEMAITAMPVIADKYWTTIVKRYPKLIASSPPPCIHTVMLSLAYNRGAYNKGLNVLIDCINSSDWYGVSELVGNMQQDHKLNGIRKRRRMEADYIRTELDFSGDADDQITNEELFNPYPE